MNLLLIKVCSKPTPVLCSFAQGTMHFPLFNAALQNRLAACLLHWKYTSDNLFCTAALDSVGRFLPRTVLQCNGAGSLHSCMNSKCS